ncbi:MAG TPA: hypothetical protein V6C76_01175 [Drouetiella sp.]
MATFDSAKLHQANDQASGKPEHQKAPDFGVDLSRDSLSANKTLPSNPVVSDRFSDLKAGVAIIGGPVATGAVLGAGFGTVAEGMFQVYKYPIAAGIGMLGGSRMAADLLRTETKYLATAARFGAEGAAAGLVLGTALFAGYETRKYFQA